MSQGGLLQRTQVGLLPGADEPLANGGQDFFQAGHEARKLSICDSRLIFPTPIVGQFDKTGPLPGISHYQTLQFAALVPAFFHNHAAINSGGVNLGAGVAETERAASALVPGSLSRAADIVFA